MSRQSSRTTTRLAAAITVRLSPCVKARSDAPAISGCMYCPRDVSLKPKMETSAMKNDSDMTSTVRAKNGLSDMIHRREFTSSTRITKEATDAVQKAGSSVSEEPTVRLGRTHATVP
ncbi:unnamed protein product [Prorocentrum cordatum]|nr:unnamed protein product [Polarella glacialis]